jgi:hypothetical protein
MKNKRVVLWLCMTLLVLFTSNSAFTESSYSPIQSAGSQPGIYVEIKPEIELLAGVLSQTSWMKARGPKGSGNEYFQELQYFFAKYKEHKAIKLAEELTEKGFTYDAPPCFILSLGPLPKLEPLNGYSDYLKKRAHGSADLEDFRQALVDLAAESRFAAFYQQHRPYLEKILSSNTYDFNGDKVVTWLQEFFGTKGDQYHLLLAPAFFPAGGYAATVNTNDGKKHIYEIIRANAESKKEPEFLQGRALEALSLHEWGHSFVNPALDQYPSPMQGLEDLFNPVKEIMAKKAYGQIDIFFHEQVLRAVVILAAESIYKIYDCQKMIDNEQNEGFYLTQFTLKQLRFYQKNWAKYPSFTEFVPYLLESYQKHKSDLLKLINLERLDSTNEIKEINILNAYWEGDPQLEGLKPKRPHSILIEVSFVPEKPSMKQISALLERVDPEFELSATDGSKAKARIYECNMYIVGKRIFWGVWIKIDDSGYAKIKPGVSYKLVSKQHDGEYRWNLKKEITLSTLF